jgi:hypothetical protein
LYAVVIDGPVTSIRANEIWKQAIDKKSDDLSHTYVWRFGESRKDIRASSRVQQVGPDKWLWGLSIQTPEEVREQVKCIEYEAGDDDETLCRDKGSPINFSFRGSSSSETLTIPIKLKFRNGTEYSYSHTIHFEKKQEAQLPIRAENTATLVKQGWYRWTVFLTSDDSAALDKIEYVRYTLHPTFPNPVQDVHRRGTDTQAFPFTASGWGTFDIPIQVVLKDGRVQNLSHQLRF